MGRSTGTKAAAAAAKRAKDTTPAKQKAQGSKLHIWIATALVVAAAAVLLAWFKLLPQSAAQSGKASGDVSRPADQEEADDPEVKGLLQRAQDLLSKGQVGAAMDLLVAAQRRNVNSALPLQALGKFQASIGKQAPRHVKTAVKAGMERLELVLYDALYAQGELAGEELLLKLAKAKMLYHSLDDPDQAVAEVTSASELLSQMVQQGAVDSQVKMCRDYSLHLQERVRERAKLTQQMKAGSSAQKLAELLLPEPSFQSVDRRANLSLEEYHRLYVDKRRPVIITDYADRTLKALGDAPAAAADGATAGAAAAAAGAWGWDEMEKVCGEMKVTLSQRHSQASHLWAGLSTSRKKVPLADWLKEIREGRAANEHYLMDWGLVGRCADFINSFVVPKYFAGDLFKRLRFNESGARDMFPHHPSVFAGAAGSGGRLHVDSHASTFWQLLLRGRKRWTLYSLPDSLRRVLLYAGVEHEVLPLAPPPGQAANLSRAPLWEIADAFKVVVEVQAGDLIVVPHDVPHMVENIEDVLAISMNVLDDVAVPRLLEDLTARTCFSNDEALHANLRVLADANTAGVAKVAGKGESYLTDARDVPFADYLTYAPLSLY